jgi:hypothetical protein
MLGITAPGLEVTQLERQLQAIEAEFQSFGSSQRRQRLPRQQQTSQQTAQQDAA